AFWRKSMAALPDTDPCRTTTEELRRVLQDGAEPMTLLLDEHLVVRQAFIGGLGQRPLGRSIERLLSAAKVSVGMSRRRAGSSLSAVADRDHHGAQVSQNHKGSEP